MTAKAKFTLALIAALCSLTVVVALANTVYLPQIEKSPTVTPTATHTLTVTPTRTLSVTLTPTRTTTPKPGVYIENIVYAPPNPMDEYIELKNTSSNSVSLEGWYIKVESNSALRYNFPKFTLGGGKTVRVWTKIGNDTASDLYWDLTTPVWKDNSDCAYLRDAAATLVDKYCY
jgi:hypothetical protein